MCGSASGPGPERGMCVVGVECGAGLRERVVVSSELEIEHITRGVCYWCEKAGLLIKAALSNKEATLSTKSNRSLQTVAKFAP